MEEKTKISVITILGMVFMWTMILVPFISFASQHLSFLMVQPFMILPYGLTMLSVFFIIDINCRKRNPK